MSACFLFRNIVFILIASFCAANLDAQKAVNISGKKQTKALGDTTAQGIEAFNRGDFETARNLLELALKNDPKNFEAHTFLGILDDGAGKFPEAEKHFSAAVRIAPDSASARNNHGGILLRLKRTAEAKTAFRTSLKIDAKQPNAMINLAQILFAEEKPESLRSALALFEKAYEIAPDSAIARSLLITALKLSDAKKASDYYRQYSLRIEKPDEAKPNSDERAELGVALFEAGLFAQAETELQSALALEPANKNAIANLARVYIIRDDVKSAGKLLETAAASGNASAAIYSLLAVVYEKVGRYDNAIPAMRLAIGLEPESEKYHYQYGLLLTNADAPAAAIIRIDEALKTFPKSARLWLARGVAELTYGKNEDAAKSIEKAIELDQDFAQAYAYLGLANVLIGRFNEAVALYEKALNKNPELSALHQMIADVMLQQNDADVQKIEAELKKSIAADPKFKLSYLTLGKLYIRQSRWTEAAEKLEKTISLDADLAEAYYHLGRVYGRLRRKEDADAALAKFKALSDTQKKESDKQLRDLVNRLANVRF